MILGALVLGMAGGAASVVLALVAGADLALAFLLYPLVGMLVTLTGALGAATRSMLSALPEQARATSHVATVPDHARTREMR